MSKQVIIHRGNLGSGRILCGAREQREYHGWSKNWVLEKDRCLNPRYIRYAEWGGRGITVCEKWISSYEAFLADVGRRPSPRHSLDRYPDNNGNYEPGNVRWATPEEQSRNRRPRRWYKKPAEAEAVNA